MPKNTFVGRLTLSGARHSKVSRCENRCGNVIAEKLQIRAIVILGFRGIELWVIRRVKISVINLKADIQYGPMLRKQAFHIDLTVRILDIERIDALKTIDECSAVLVLKKSIKLHFSLHREHSVLTRRQNRIELLCSGADIDIESALL